jgi:hypothetical protein
MKRTSNYLANSPNNLAGIKKELKYEVEQQLLANSPINLAGMRMNKKCEVEQQLFGEQS